MATVTTILGLTALTTILSDDVVPVVDVHDTTQSPSGSTKKITVANLFAPYAPLSGATFTGGVSGTTLSLSSTLSASGNITAPRGLFGTTPGTTGAVGIPNNVALTARNAANSGDVTLIYADGSDRTILGGGTVVVQPTAGNNLGFFGSAGATKGTLSGAKGGNVALANLITLLASHGLLTDSTT